MVCLIRALPLHLRRGRDILDTCLLSTNPALFQLWKVNRSSLLVRGQTFPRRGIPSPMAPRYKVAIMRGFSSIANLTSLGRHALVPWERVRAAAARD